MIPRYVPACGSGAAPVLVTGATGRVGRLVVDELLRADVPVRALTRRPEQAALPAGVEVVVGDLTAPESLDVALQGVGAVLLVWTAALADAATRSTTVDRIVRAMVHAAKAPAPGAFVIEPGAMPG